MQKNKDDKIPQSPDSFKFNPQQLPRPEPKADEPITVVFGWHSGPSVPLYTPQTEPQDMIKRTVLKTK
jgi:hypothetical protein